MRPGFKFPVDSCRKEAELAKIFIESFGDRETVSCSDVFLAIDKLSSKDDIFIGDVGPILVRWGREGAFRVGVFGEGSNRFWFYEQCCPTCHRFFEKPTKVCLDESTYTFYTARELVVDWENGLIHLTAVLFGKSEKSMEFFWGKISQFLKATAGKDKKEEQALRKRFQKCFEIALREKVERIETLPDGADPV